MVAIGANVNSHTLYFLLATFITAVFIAPKAYASDYSVDQLSHAAVQLLVADGLASGTLIVRNNRALVLTNRHVVENLTDVHVAVLVDTTKPAQALFRAEVRGFSMEYDFAYLELTHELAHKTDQLPLSSSELPAFSLDKLRNGEYGFQLPTLNISQGTHLNRGDSIAIFGYPALAQNELIYSVGNIASVRYESLNNTRVPLWYRTDATISQGNSGGLAVNSQGQFVGIPTSVNYDYDTGGRLSNILAAPVVLAMLNNPSLLVTDWELFRNMRQQILDFTQPPSQSEIHLNSNSLSADIRHVTSSGGAIDASYLGGECVGYTQQAPNFRFHLAEPLSQLSVAFKAQLQGSDATLVISTPDSRWHCNDDADGMNPRVNFNQAPAGQYDVWVGNYSEGTIHDGTLEIASVLNARGGLNQQAEPQYGVLKLASGFAVEQGKVEISGGGLVNLFSFNLFPCVGFTASAPDLKLHWAGSNSPLFMHFQATREGDDPSLIIAAPNGQLYCNDDADMNSVNPAMAFKNAPTGIYSIWIGSYNGNKRIPGVFSIAEKPSQ
nr:serine protease [Aliidiomarina quisquiliarum]